MRVLGECRYPYKLKHPSTRPTNLDRPTTVQCSQCDKGGPDSFERVSFRSPNSFKIYDNYHVSSDFFQFPELLCYCSLIFRERFLVGRRKEKYLKRIKSNDLLLLMRTRLINLIKSYLRILRRLGTLKTFRFHDTNQIYYYFVDIM